MFKFAFSKRSMAISLVQLAAALLFAALGHKYVAVLVMIPHFNA